MKRVKNTFTETELTEITNIQKSTGVTRKTAIKKMRAAAKVRAKEKEKANRKAVEGPDFKAAAANDKSHGVVLAVTPIKPNQVHGTGQNRTPAGRAPKQGVIALRLTPEQVSKNRSEGLRLFKLAGRPTADQFIKVFGANGAKQTWEQRAKVAQLASADEAATPFQTLLAKVQ